ncbi:MFS transporter [Microlunatus soli]|uniref:Predicted arabinose efflux permease, MFS family n=1 Tax=Microlunatus soli TaxID=630515 RepID=A0A1H1MZX5_9ACTN|nr:MFS transporter [Microlunatus soli]SDR92220.1 Predicted arabinose efflux permease, MFS family [Microlunatus soli]
MQQLVEARADPERAGRTVRWGGVAAALFAVAWGGNQFTPLLTMYRQHSGFSSQAVTVLLAAYVIGIIPALLLGGPLSDRYGRRPLMYPAPLIAAAGSALLAVGASAEPVLFAGRLLSGVALGLGMAVGSSWIKELSMLDPAGIGRGASRSSTALSAGFAVGAAAAAALAQYAPWPTALAYLLHIVIALAATVAVIGAPETRPTNRSTSRGTDTADTRPRRRLIDDLRVPAARQRRFLLVVLPMAPWIFGFAGSAYAILPTLTGGWTAADTAWSGLHCLLALGCGIAVQPLGRRLGAADATRAIVLGLAIGIAGLLVGSTALITGAAIGSLIAAVVLGTGYGMLLSSGLQEVQRIAGPDDLAGLTAVYYALSYLGFCVPAVLAALSPLVGYPVLFDIGAGIGLIALLVVLIGSRTARGVSAQQPGR